MININKRSGDSNASNFLPTDNFNWEIILKFINEYLVAPFMKIFRPVEVSGYFDDLIGQQYLIILLLLILLISIILLFILYIFINIFLHNKEIFLNRFDNKFIRFHIKYQIILANLSLFIIPIIISIGLITMTLCLHFLITHPILYEQLDIDLHTFLGKK